MYTTIIWDWNGTLLNDVDCNIQIINILLKERNLPEVSVLRYKELFRMPIRDFYVDIGFDLGAEKFEKIAQEYNTLYEKKFAKMSLNAGIIEVLSYIQKKGLTQIILSASEQQTLHRQVKEKGIEHFFKTIIGNDDFSVVSKIEKARLLKNQISNTEKLLYIGDLSHDFDVAQVLDADCFLYEHGHQGHTSSNEYILIKNMEEILSLL